MELTTDQQNKNQPVSRWTHHALYFVCILVVSLQLLSTSNGYNGIDFYHFWIVPKVVKEHNENGFYRLENQAKYGAYYREKYFKHEGSPVESRHPLARYFNGLDPLKDVLTDLEVSADMRKEFILTATPLLYASLSPFMGEDFAQDYLVFRAVGIVSGILGFLILAHLVGLPTGITYCASVFFLMFYFQIRLDAIVGNVGQIQLLMVAAFLWLYRKGLYSHRFYFVAAGWMLAFGVIFKPVFFAVIPILVTYWCFRRSWQTLANMVGGMIAGTLSALAISYAFYASFVPWQDWCQLVATSLLGRGDFSVSQGNDSLAQMAHEYLEFNIFWSAFIITCILLGFFVLIIDHLLKNRRSLPIVDDTAVYLLTAVGCSATLLASKLVWQFYEILLIPLFLYLLKIAVTDLHGEQRSQRLLLLLLIFIGLILDPNDWRFRYVHPHLVAQTNVLSALALFALGLMALFRLFRPETSKEIG